MKNQTEKSCCNSENVSRSFWRYFWWGNFNKKRILQPRNDQSNFEVNVGTKSVIQQNTDNKNVEKKIWSVKKKKHK